MMPYYYGYGDSGYGMGWEFGIFGMIFHVLFIIAVIWLVVWLLRGLGMGRHGRRHWLWESHAALSILNERFAKGEIDKAEYEERKRVLLGDTEKKG